MTAQLIDALTGYHLWAKRYDQEIKDLFVLQDDLTRKILKGMEQRLTRREDALKFEYPKNIAVYLKLIQGRETLREFNKDANNRARLIAEECLALEPDYYGSHGLMGSVHMMDYWLGSTTDPAKSLQTAIEYLEKAAELSDLGPHLPVLGNLYAIKKDSDRAIDLGAKAINLLPNSADAHAWLAMSLNFAGREPEALPLFEKSLRLNPFPPAFYYQNFGHTYRVLKRYEQAVAMYKKAVALTPNNIFAQVKDEV